MAYTEILHADYAMTLRHIIWELPITAGFSLLQARGHRLGEDRPGHGDHAAAAARARAKAYFEANFQII